MPIGEVRATWPGGGGVLYEYLFFIFQCDHIVEPSHSCVDFHTNNNNRLHQSLVQEFRNILSSLDL